MFKIRTPIHYKITFIFAIIITISLFGIYLYLNKNLNEHTYNRIKTNLLKKTSLAKTFLEKHSSTNASYDELDKIADTIGDDLNLRATIIDINGVVLGDSELDGKALRGVENHLYRPEVQMALKDGAGESRRFSTTVQKDMLYVAIPYGGKEVGGVMRLSMPLVEIEVISSRLTKSLLIALFITLVVSLIISFIASALISKPLREMSWISRTIAQGDFSKKAMVESKDEIGDLAKAFNYMSEQVKQRIQEVTLSKSRLEAVLSSMFEGVMVVSLDGHILLMNEALKKFLLINEDPLEKRPIEVIRNIQIQEIVDNTLKSADGVKSYEVSLLLPEEKVALIHATSVIREGEPEGVVLVFHDITELRRLESVRRDFVANVSHELRTPATSIKGYAETLLDGAINDKENAQDFLRIICSDSDRLATLVDDLLDLSKIESGKLSINPSPQSITPIVERVISSLKKQANERSISINVQIPEKLPHLLVDEAAISQVLLNLIDNAIKYNSENGTITINAQDIDEYVQINIADSGIGIPEENLTRIFERFYRVDKARSRELGGTGLGLAIVKHIVQAHNGKVFVRSQLDKGSTFSFTVPKA